MNTVNNKTYIGVHKTTQNNFDGYIGCGVDITRPSTYKKSKTAFQYAVNKYGVDKFSRSTLFTFDNELDAYNKESELVTIEYVKNPNTYNLIVGGRLNTNHANQYKEVHMYNIHGEYIKSFETVLTINAGFKLFTSLFEISIRFKSGYEIKSLFPTGIYNCRAQIV